ncbi:uncharacterized protein LOC130405168 isoform X2 [Gadus chalcogrammus]|uniref:uncharacterized protein LOC130405168 isoform X2 n=2 Tax=Gadus chalcogrammus TaxID=1042646 RepID=UPI0024C47656|nr:uncharacterized protein LOC130405168 isoform X2 [Gadus chalcogrammus]
MCGHEHHVNKERSACIRDGEVEMPCLALHESHTHIHIKNMARGGFKKSCPACQANIFNGCKVCPMCKAPQPQKLRLKKKLEKFKKEKDTWVANTKKNQITSHLMDDAVILMEKLNAVGWKPILLLEYPKKEARMLLPEGLVPSVGEKKCLDDIEEMYTFMIEASPTTTTTTTTIEGPETGVKPETVETALSASPATNNNRGTGTGNKRKRRPSTKVDTLPTTSPATTNRGTETGNKRKRHPSTKVKTVLSTSPNTTTNGGRETETVETVLSASPATTNNDWQNTKQTPKETQPIPPLPPPRLHSCT